ncbi:aminoglycoside phosphotransferase family protein [Flexivirga caeni]|uniref:Aminoglycoside phosphotransferase family protein n=1 Tax=Flexivirga caeni TaxID=2294115 RepID=A0A3M9M7C1_9MICO|nr:aminoglycoside phosphotransferase family protein [Flexivirga caeni]RNI21376.1 aminoglycoside phosphotransferase family protein [Flexivirga caeni]
MSSHQHARGQRIGFAQAPVEVRQWVRGRLGDPIADVIDCTGGMSPGPAARLRSDSGTRVFAKACGPELNPDTPGLIRSEGRLLAGLPEHPCLPRLLDLYDDGRWVALLLEDLPGELPGVPWSADDLRRASGVVAKVRRVLDDVSAGWLPSARGHAPLFTDAWKLLGERLGQVDPWWAKHHDQLAAHAERAATLIDGESVLHWDVRADNLIFAPGRDVLIDWGQARRGAPWLDHALLATDCAMSGSVVSAMDFFAFEPALAERDPADLVSLMAAAAMTFAARMSDPAPPGLPTMPATRARWAENLRRELAELL